MHNIALCFPSSSFSLCTWWIATIHYTQWSSVKALPQLYTSIGLTKQKMQSLTTLLAAYKLGLKIQMHNKYCKRDRHNNKLHAMAMRGTVYHQSFAVCVWVTSILYILWRWSSNPSDLSHGDTTHTGEEVNMCEVIRKKAYLQQVCPVVIKVLSDLKK